MPHQGLSEEKTQGSFWAALCYTVIVQDTTSPEHLQRGSQRNIWRISVHLAWLKLRLLSVRALVRQPLASVIRGECPCSHQIRPVAVLVKPQKLHGHIIVGLRNPGCFGVYQEEMWPTWLIICAFKDYLWTSCPILWVCVVQIIMRRLESMMQFGLDATGARSISSQRWKQWWGVINCITSFERLKPAQTICQWCAVNYRQRKIGY